MNSSYDVRTSREVSLTAFLRRFGRMLKRSGNIGRAERLERRGRIAEARVALLEALDTVEEADASLLEPATSSTRLVAVTRLACIAAALKDHAEAIRFTREGLALWSETRMAAPGTRSVQGFVEWESWARTYLAYTVVDRVPGPVKMDFASDGALDCPLIRIYGYDREAIQALKIAFASASRAPIAVHAVRGIDAIGGCHLTAAPADRDRGARRVGSLAIEWAMSSEGWAGVIELLEPFEDPAPENSFQYLSREGEVTVLISRDGRW